MSYDSTPSFEITKHYLKDLSVENPHGNIVLEQDEPIDLDFNLNLDIEILDETQNIYQVTLQADAKHDNNEQVLFFCELSYVLEVQINEIPEALIEKILNVDVPQLGYPIVDSIIRQNSLFSGYQNINIQPLDFEAFFIENSQNNDQNQSELA